MHSRRADSRFAPSQWETVLLCNDVSHWLGPSLELVLFTRYVPCSQSRWLFGNRCNNTFRVIVWPYALPSVMHADNHYIDVKMTTMPFQITSLTVVYSIVYSGVDKKKPIKAPCHWPLCGEFTGTGEFPAQRVSNVENVSIWWRHHDNRKKKVNHTHPWCSDLQRTTPSAGGMRKHFKFSRMYNNWPNITIL